MYWQFLGVPSVCGHGIAVGFFVKGLCWAPQPSSLHGTIYLLCWSVYGVPLVERSTLYTVSGLLQPPIPIGAYRLLTWTIIWVTPPQPHCLILLYLSQDFMTECPPYLSSWVCGLVRSWILPFPSDIVPPFDWFYVGVNSMSGCCDQYRHQWEKGWTGRCASMPWRRKWLPCIHAHRHRTLILWASGHARSLRPPSFSFNHLIDRGSPLSHTERHLLWFRTVDHSLASKVLDLIPLWLGDHQGTSYIQGSKWTPFPSWVSLWVV